MIIKEFVKKRGKILSQEPVDIEKLKKLMEEVGVDFPKDPLVIKITIHKIRANSTNVPKELVERSKQWLRESGYSLDVPYG